MANFFNFNGQTFRGAYYPNGIRVTYPDGSQTFMSETDFQTKFDGWVPGIDEKTAACMEFLYNTFSGMRNRPEIERARIERARQLGGTICERPAGNGVGSVYVKKSRPGVLVVQLGSDVKGRGRYAVCAEFWVGNLIEQI